MSTTWADTERAIDLLEDCAEWILSDGLHGDRALQGAVDILNRAVAHLLEMAPEPREHIPSAYYPERRALLAHCGIPWSE